MIRNLLFRLFCVALMLGNFSSSLFAQDDDSEDTPLEATNPQISLGFFAHNGFYRQILMGFDYAAATDDIDPGYDAVNTFDLPNDMFFYTQNTELFIQGVGAFDPSKTYPIGVQTNESGEVIIALESILNFPATQEFFLYDTVTQTSHNLRGGSVTIDMEQGVFNERFQLRFAAAVLNTPDIENANRLNMAFAGNTNVLKLSNAASETGAKITVFNISGQKVDTFSVQQSNNEFALNHLSPGTYIAVLESPSARKVLKFLKG